MKSKFIINDREIEVPVGRILYNKVRQDYMDYSTYLVEDFTIRYRKENRDLKDVYYNVLAQGDKSIEEACHITSAHLRDQGIMDIDGDQLFINYRKTDRYRVWKEAVEDIRAAYEELDREEKNILQEEEKKEEENILEGAGRILKDTINLVGKTASKSVSFFEKQSLFKDKDTLKSLVEALQTSIYLLHQEYISLVERNKGEKIYQDIRLEDEEEADEIFRRISNNIISQRDEQDAIETMINLNPYNEEYYKYLYREHGDDNGDLGSLAQIFNLDISPYKLEDLESFYKSFQLSILDHLEQVPEGEGFLEKFFSSKDSLREEGYIWKPTRVELIEYIRLYLIKISLLKYCEKIHLDRDNEVIDSIDQEIGAYSKNFRMVNGREYPNLKEALGAKLERESIFNYLEELDHTSEIRVREARELIETVIDSPVKEVYLMDLEDDLIDIIDRDIKDLIDESKPKTIEDWEVLGQYLSKKYEEDYVEKHIKSINNKIGYLRTKDKLVDTYDGLVSKGKKLLGGLFKDDRQEEVLEEEAPDEVPGEEVPLEEEAWDSLEEVDPAYEIDEEEASEEDK